MFCPECGQKNENSARFCENCGTSLPENRKIKKTKTFTFSKLEITKLKQSITKKQKITYSIVLAIILCCTSFYMYGKIITNPKNIAKNYFLAQMQSDSDTLYDYLDIEKSEFTTKELFKKIVKKDQNPIQLINYKIGKPSISKDGLTATVPISYITKQNNHIQSTSIQLKKTTNKKYVFFNEWKISNTSTITKTGIKLKVVKDSIVKIEGITVDKKYLLKEQSSNFDIYELPSVLTNTYEIKVTLPNQYEMIEEVTFSPFTEQKTINNFSLNEDQISLNKKEFDEIRFHYQYDHDNLSDLKNQYQTLKQAIEKNTFTISNIQFTDIIIKNIDITNQGNLIISFRTNGNYDATYQNGSEPIVVNQSYIDDARFTFQYKDRFYLIETSGLNIYFSKE